VKHSSTFALFGWLRKRVLNIVFVFRDGEA
jgi:hypothetical protein